MTVDDCLHCIANGVILIARERVCSFGYVLQAIQFVESHSPSNDLRVVVEYTVCYSRATAT
jgi:hypothetical protein